MRPGRPAILSVLLLAGCAKRPPPDPVVEQPRCPPPPFTGATRMMSMYPDSWAWVPGSGWQSGWRGEIQISERTFQVFASCTTPAGRRIYDWFLGDRPFLEIIEEEIPNKEGEFLPLRTHAKALSRDLSRKPPAEREPEVIELSEPLPAGVVEAEFRFGVFDNDETGAFESGLVVSIRHGSQLTRQVIAGCDELRIGHYGVDPWDEFADCDDETYVIFDQPDLLGVARMGGEMILSVPLP